MHPQHSHPHHPPPAARWLAGLALAAALAPSAPAATGTHNVSQLVLGTQEPLPDGPGRTWACGSACRYLSVTGVQMADGHGSWPGADAQAGWPAFYSNIAPLYASLEDALPLPAPPAGTAYSIQPGGPASLHQRARVAFSPLGTDPASSRQMAVQTFRSGRGASALSYAVQIRTPADGARRTYLQFQVPTRLRSWQHASSIGGPSGNQPFTTLPERLQARSVVDVYVDGLPVWQAQSLRLRPQRYHSSNPDSLLIDWGQTLDGGMATLFLGTLPAGSLRTAVIVLRTDLRVDAPTCHTVNNPLGLDQRRCDSELEALTLPSRSEAPFYIHTPDITVFTR